MKIIPSIDLYNGQCVRLKQGKLENKTVYPVSPVEYAKECVRHNLYDIHIVDLNRVFIADDSCNMHIIKEIAKIPKIKLQIGGGINSIELAQEYIDAGAERLCLGSVVACDPDKAQEIITGIGADRIIICADFRDGNVFVRGWMDDTEISIFKYISEVSAKFKVYKFLCTDVSRDGMSSGYSEQMYKELRATWPEYEFIASGGCSSFSDIRNLEDVTDSCIVGKSMFDAYLAKLSGGKDYNNVYMEMAKNYMFSQCLDWEKCNGLIPCIVQDYKSKDVLMLAYMNKKALEITIYSRNATFYSRSRQELWIKGKSHGKTLPVIDLKMDCDNDAILLYVDSSEMPEICHLGQETCWGDRDFSLEYLYRYIDRINHGEIDSTYTKYLLDGPVSLSAQKVGEEAVETVIEAIKEDKKATIYESADLLYHLLVMLNRLDIPLQDVINELKSRHKKK